VMFPCLALAGGPRIDRLVVAHLIGGGAGQQTRAIDAPETGGSLLFGDSFANHGIANLIGDPNARGAGSKNDDALVAQGSPTDTDGGGNRRQRDGAGPLDVFVEGAGAIAVAIQNAPSIEG